MEGKDMFGFENSDKSKVVPDLDKLLNYMPDLPEAMYNISKAAKHDDFMAMSLFVLKTMVMYDKAKSKLLSESKEKPNDEMTEMMAAFK